ncbi:hypothetical protein V8F06_013492 [Rhypophila decipiens]
MRSATTASSTLPSVESKEMGLQNALSLYHYHSHRDEDLVDKNPNAEPDPFDSSLSGYTGILRELIDEIPTRGPERLLRKLSVDRYDPSIERDIIDKKNVLPSGCEERNAQEILLVRCPLGDNAGSIRPSPWNGHARVCSTRTESKHFAQYFRKLSRTGQSIMLPAPLKTIYQQYKDDTSCVATWLANTANQHCYGPSPDANQAKASNNPTATSQRVKGKALLSLWDQWAKGELDLTAAAVATNTAFELAWTMEDEIRPVLDKKGGGAKVASRYHEVLCKRAGIRINVMSHSHWDESYEIGMETLVNIGQAVPAFAQSAARAQKEILKVPPVYNGRFGWYDESQAGRASSSAGKLARDKAIFSELFADLHFAARDPHCQIFLPDQLIRGMDQFVNSVGTDDDFDMNCTPLWFAWAVRTYLDIVVKLGKDCSKGFFQMQDEIYHMKRPVSGITNPDVLPGVQAFRQGTRQLRPGLHARETSPGHCRRHAHAKLHAARPAIPILAPQPHILRPLAAPTPPRVPPPGRQLRRPAARIMHVTQLYHVLRQEKLLPEPLKWHDLETFRQMQGDSAFFVGEPPSTMDGHYKNYTLCIGNSITNWAKNKRLGKGGRPASNKPTVTNLQNRRDMNMLGTLSCMMRNRIGDLSNKGPLSAEVIEAILEKGRDLAARNGRRRKEKRGGTTPVNVLRQLALDIDADVPNLKFDYITMHNTCWDLLLRLKTKFSEVMGTDMSNHLPPTEVHLTFLVGYVFLFASGHSAELTVKTAAWERKQYSLFLKEGNNATRILDAQKKGLSNTEKKALDDAFDKYRVKDTFPGYEEGMRQMGRRPDGPDSDDEGGDDFGDGRDLEQELMEVARGNPEAARLVNMLQQMMGGQGRGGQGRGGQGRGVNLILCRMLGDEKLQLIQDETNQVLSPSSSGFVPLDFRPKVDEFGDWSPADRTADRVSGGYLASWVVSSYSRFTQRHSTGEPAFDYISSPSTPGSTCKMKTDDCFSCLLGYRKRANISEL